MYNIMSTSIYAKVKIHAIFIQYSVEVFQEIYQFRKLIMS
jgi:hypothetical protein